MVARWVNVVLGMWLFISAFSWPHSIGTQTNTWAVGALIAMTALGAMYEPATRWANTVLSLWLFVTSFWFFHPSPATTWNNAVVAGRTCATFQARGRGAGDLNERPEWLARA